MKACINDNVNIIIILIRNGLDINERGIYGYF